MSNHRIVSSPATPARRHRFSPILVLSLSFLITAALPAVAQHDDTTFTGPPDASALASHVVLPNLGDIDWPLSCSSWPESAPAGGHLASVFGHRIHNGGDDFHRGIDLRCDLDGDTCCQEDDGTGNGTGPITCEEKSCPTGYIELPGAPVYALISGTIERVHHKSNNNLVIQTDRASNDLSIGDTDCNVMYTWYQHMRTEYAKADIPGEDREWRVGDWVDRGALLGWQGRSGASTHHLHLSTRLCTNDRADGEDVGTLDPEFNPFQLIGSDNGQPPAIRSLSSEMVGTELVVTVEIETDDPDFDKLEITVYDAPSNESHRRRLGYNSRLGIDVAGGNIDTFLLQPLHRSELTAILEPDPPVSTSGFTLEARFPGLGLTEDPGSLVQAKVADVFGNTAVREIQIFGSAEIGDLVWSDNNSDGLQDVSEPGLAGVTVDLLSSSGTLISSAVTDAQGNYSFVDLIAGDYFLRFQAPAGYGATGQVPGFPDLDSNMNPMTFETAVFNLTSGETDLSLDAGFTSACFDAALVGARSVWRTSDLYAAGWNTPSFDDSGWSELQGVLGFGDSAVDSTIPKTGLTSYFRLSFEIDDVSLFDTFDLSLLRDDGAVVYLNGVEVMRSNMPSGTIDDDTPASSHSETTVGANLPASYLLNGTNVLAVEVHNRELSSSDLYFDLELSSLVCRSCVSEVSLSSSAETFIEAGESPRGNKDEIEIDGSPDKHGLLSWSFAGLPSDTDVLQAELIVEVTNKSSHEYLVYALNRAWNEGDATWVVASGTPFDEWQSPGANHASDRGSTPLGVVHLTTAPMTGTVLLNASGRALVQDWIDGTVANHGLIIAGESQSDGLDLESGDVNNTAPRLRLIYASACGVP